MTNKFWVFAACKLQKPGEREPDSYRYFKWMKVMLIIDTAGEIWATIPNI